MNLRLAAGSDSLVSMHYSLKIILTALLPAMMLSACQNRPSPAEGVGVPGAATAGWRSVITDNDYDRLRRLRAAWTQGLKDARAAGHGSEIEALGRFADPDHALDSPLPPAGIYRCRTIKIGAKGPINLNYIAYQPFQCSVSVNAAGEASLEKLTGSQRPTGVLWPDNKRRMVFLGSLILGDERSALPYGADRDRSLVGVIEQVEADRWRVAFPWPAWESMLDLIELVPTSSVE